MARTKTSRKTGLPLGRVEEARPGWWGRQGEDLVRELLVAAVVGAALLAAGFAWDAQMAERDEANAEAIALNAEMLENTRYVRSLSGDASGPPSFLGMYLRGANLATLELSCSDAEQDEPGAACASFDNADLRGANFVFAQLSGASFANADLRDAVLAGATLNRVMLTGARLDGVSLEGATIKSIDLRDVDLGGADLESAVLGAVCHDASTVWPDGFSPPESAERACEIRVDSGIDLSN